MGSSASFFLTKTLMTLLLSLTAIPITVNSCPSSEWAALMSIKASLKEPNFPVFQTWRGTNCCYRWFGVTCDPTTRRVTKINLNALTITDYHRNLPATTTPYMTGHISSSICNLTQLFSITISDWKGISGNIPNCITTLSFLQYLDLSGNHITGQIPFSIGRLTLLTVLNLADNHISGNIPDSLVSLSNLMTLDLRNNAIQGPIPWAFGGLKKLNQALLSHNQLTGPIPPSVSKVYGLADLDLSLNRLSGSVPGWLGKMAVLDSLKLRGNKLTEEIPREVLGSRMSVLDLSGNALSGRIANVFGAKSYFISINLSRNNLTGSVAKSMVLASYIGYLDLSHNRLCGAIRSASRYAAGLQPLLMWQAA
ncbi:hypothetical protein RJT34_30120 [Clitoria ternatea]|uniref:Leucine-rich repeat-containing N-terminal plant-type domain-containing protein n=1 Tax=Clitoria ternatea TaxID=43366 RepID=A0AAN9EU12_CLITE